MLNMTQHVAQSYHHKHYPHAWCYSLGGHKTSTIQKFRLIIVHTRQQMGWFYHRPQMVLLMVTKRFPKVVTAQRCYFFRCNLCHFSKCVPHIFSWFWCVFPRFSGGSQVTRCHHRTSRPSVAPVASSAALRTSPDRSAKRPATAWFFPRVL